MNCWPSWLKVSVSDEAARTVIEPPDVGVLFFLLLLHPARASAAASTTAAVVRNFIRFSLERWVRGAGPPVREMRHEKILSRADARSTGRRPSHPRPLGRCGAVPVAGMLDG